MTSDHGDSRRWPSVGEFVPYLLAALLITVLLAILGGVSPAAADLADNDGYMRFLRIRDLANGGEWFNPVVVRSNFPYGEMLHWTRPLDVYVLALAAILRPFLGTESLYWAAFVNGPLLLVVLGPLTYWAVGWLLRPGIRSILMPALLGLPVVVAYLGWGRVDHHGPILLLFVWTLGLVLRACVEPGRVDAAALGLALALGLWVSVEFLVPWALVAATLAVLGLAGDGRDLSAFAARTFAWTAGVTFVAVLIERGVPAVDYERISVVHIALAGAIWLVFQSIVWFRWSDLPTPLRWVAPTGVAVVASLGFLRAFPGFLSGPFVEFAPEVRERWLSHVTELLPVSLSEGFRLLAFRVVPLALGVTAWLIARQRRDRRMGRGVNVAGAWLIVYAGLTLAQFRWTLFSHTLALVLLLVALEPAYERLGDLKMATLIRPSLVALLLALPLLGAGSGFGTKETGPGGPSCALQDVLPAMRTFGSTTVLADLDIGPEILYRTVHNVIATPYGNASALDYMLDTMAESDMGAVRGRLAERSVGLILLCPTSQDLTHPIETAGTFYAALVDGPRPTYLNSIAVPDYTDYLLFAVTD